MLPIPEVTGTVCYGLPLIPAMGFKARVDAPSHVLHFALRVMDPSSQL